MNDQHNSNNNPNNIKNSHTTSSSGRYKPYRKINPAYLAKIQQVQKDKYRVDPSTQSVPKPNTKAQTVVQPIHKAKGSSKSSHNKRTISASKILIAVVVILIIIGLASVAVYSYVLYSGAKSKTNLALTGEAQQALNTTQSEETLRDLRKIVVLPSDEEPKMAIIRDIGQLSTAKFYKDSKNGDIVILYNKSQKAYIYRPANKTVINFISFQSNELEQTVK